MLRHVRENDGFIGPVALKPSKLGNGLGCFTTRDVAFDEMLFIVPAPLQISGPTALACPTCGPGFRADGVEPTCAIAGFMACMLLTDCPLHAPYLRTLPFEPDASHVLWWSDAEVALLDGSSAHAEACELRAQAQRAIQAALRNAPLRCAVQAAVRHAARDDDTDLSDADIDAQLADAVRGACCCIFSRAFGVKDARHGREMVRDRRSSSGP